jgi:anaerobic dimethyl sulfoxide reductase subunit C (anchor subunit)
MKHWSLIPFTLISQTAVGMYAVVAGIDLISNDLSATSRSHVLLIAFILMVIALFLSITHLGSPGKAYWAVANLRQSWLSREILFALLFTTGVALRGYLVWQGYSSPFLDGFVTGLTLIFGFTFILSMGILYRLRTVKIWNTPLTPISFFLTSLIMGGAVVGWIVIENKRLLHPFVIGLFILLASELWLTYLWTVRPYELRIANNEKLDSLSNPKKIALILRPLFSILGLIILGILFIDGSYPSEGCLFGVSFIIIGEILGRYLFYAAEEWTREM